MPARCQLRGAELNTGLIKSNPKEHVCRLEAPNVSHVPQRTPRSVCRAWAPWHTGATPSFGAPALLQSSTRIRCIPRAGFVPSQYLPWLTKATQWCSFMRADTLAAQIEQESNWNPNAVSSIGAQGISQFLPGTWATFGVDANGDGRRDPFNPADGIVSQAITCATSWANSVPALRGPRGDQGGRGPRAHARDGELCVAHPERLLPKYRP